MGELPSLIIGRDVQSLPDALALSSPSLSSLSSLSPSNSQTPSSPNPPLSQVLLYQQESERIHRKAGTPQGAFLKVSVSRALSMLNCITPVHHPTMLHTHTTMGAAALCVCDAVSLGAAGGVTLLSSDVYTPGALGILGS